MNRHHFAADHRLLKASASAIEPLEQRMLLSVDAPLPVITPNSATLRNGTLLVQGSDKADVISMSLSHGDQGLLEVNINGKLAGKFDVGSVKYVRAYGLGGSDKISVDEDEGAVTTRVYMFGGNGNDTLASGSGPDFLIGAKGDDFLSSGSGNDYIEGNAGNDRILAGDGVDTVNGGPGRDTINTGAGKDKVVQPTKYQVIDKGAALTLEADKKYQLTGTPIIRRPGRRGAPAAFFGTPTGLTPQQIRTAYQFGDLSDPNFQNRGAGQTIAIIDAYHYATALNDLNVFSQEFGLPAVSSKMFKYVYASGNQPLGNRGWAGEAALDIEWAHAIAPAAKILLVEADTAFPGDISVAIARAAQALQPTGGVVSMSLGGDESLFDIFNTPDFRNIDTSNVSFVASSGDTAGQVSTPATDSEVLSVGGTLLTVDADGNRLDESAWSDGGGGTSQVFDRPGYQDNLIVNNNPIGDFRVVPDVAYNADPNSGVSVYNSTPNSDGNTGWETVGGTSAGAPQWAGLVALANERRLANGLPMLGNGQLNNYIYGIARKYGDTTFNDITTGDNFFHQATDGFDQTTGWGTPQASNLIDQLAIAQSKNRVSARVNLHFVWQGDLRKDLLFPLVDNIQAVINYTGEGTAKVAPSATDLLFDQGTGPDPVTGIPAIAPADQIDINGLNMERVGNTITGRGVASVVTADGYAANLVIRFEGRLFRVNGQDKITGKMYAISHHGLILKQGEDAVFSGEFSSPGDANP